MHARSSGAGETCLADAFARRTAAASSRRLQTTTHPPQTAATGTAEAPCNSHRATKRRRQARTRPTDKNVRRVIGTVARRRRHQSRGVSRHYVEACGAPSACRDARRAVGRPGPVHPELSVSDRHLVLVIDRQHVRVLLQPAGHGLHGFVRGGQRGEGPARAGDASARAAVLRRRFR